MEGLCSTATCVCVYFPMYLTKSCRLNFSVHWATMCPCILVRSKLCKRIKKTHSSEPQLDESWRWKHDTSTDQKPTKGLERKDSSTSAFYVWNRGSVVYFWPRRCWRTAEHTLAQSFVFTCCSGMVSCQLCVDLHDLLQNNHRQHTCAVVPVLDHR